MPWNKEKGILQEPLPDDLVKIARSKDLILRILKGIAEHTFALADAIHDVKANLSGDPLGFLVAECQVSRGDAEKLLKFEESLKGKRELLTSSLISHTALMALSDADATVRKICLERIEAGTVLDEKGIFDIAEELAHQSRPVEDRIKEQKFFALQKLAIRRVKPIMRFLDKNVNLLLDAVHRLFLDHLCPPPEADVWSDVVIDPESEDYARAFGVVRKHAETALRAFEHLFGTEHVPRSLWPKDAEIVNGGDFQSAEVALSKAHVALRRFARGEFGHNGGFLVPPDDDCPVLLDIWDAAAYLVNDPKPIGMASTEPVSEVSPRLVSLQLCAGAGGMAIGLHGAGFDADAMFDKDPDAVKTLETNWPWWKVYKQDVRDSSFKQWTGVDLLAAELPSKEYVQGGRFGRKLGKAATENTDVLAETSEAFVRTGINHSGNNKLEETDDLLMELVRIVEEVRPKAFLFDHVQGLMFNRAAKRRAKFTDALYSLGYSVEFHSLDGSLFKPDRARKRVVIVGMPGDCMARFAMPTIRGPSVAEVIGDLMMVHRCPPGERPELTALAWGRKSKDERFERWAQWWLEKYGKEGPAENFAIDAVFKSKSKSVWGQLGLKSGTPAAVPPTPADIRTMNDLPKPTLEMIQRLQGFPKEWKFAGDEDSQFLQMAEAFPPKAARAIGLAIHTALTGVRFDTDAVFKTHPMPASEIGRGMPRLVKRRSLMPAWRRVDYYHYNSDHPPLEEPDKLNTLYNSTTYTSRDRGGRREEEYWAGYHTSKRD